MVNSPFLSLAELQNIEAINSCEDLLTETLVYCQSNQTKSKTIHCVLVKLSFKTIKPDDPDIIICFYFMFFQWNAPG